jgi:hypothetical protein
MEDINRIMTDSAAVGAFKVKSVAEEYDILTKLHGEPLIDFIILGQVLLFNKGKPYDKINICLTNGKEMSYLFEIGSFFGK